MEQDDRFAAAGFSDMLFHSVGSDKPMRSFGNLGHREARFLEAGGPQVSGILTHAMMSILLVCFQPYEWAGAPAGSAWLAAR